MKIGEIDITKAFLGELELTNSNAYIGEYQLIKGTPAPNYFYLENASSSSTNTLSIVTQNSSVPSNEIYYSYDQENWVLLGNTSTTALTKEFTDKIYLKAVSSDGYGTGTSITAAYGTKINATGLFNAGGNIMSLLYGDGYYGKKELTSAYTFTQLFAGSNIYNAGDLKMPATTLSVGCYSRMFFSCIHLIQVPKLPATIMRPGCYYRSFAGCSALTKAPALPATTLATDCYSDMFVSCSKLTTAPALPATTLAPTCYNMMFWGCSSLTTAPDLPATTLAARCYGTMFRSCTSLTKAPKLPATTLTTNCYRGMFYGCTSLISAPDLPATTLVAGCYNDMFHDCSTLSYIKALFTTTPGSDYTENWVSGVHNVGTFVKSSKATWDVTGTNGVPEGWTVKKNELSYLASSEHGNAYIDTGINLTNTMVIETNMVITNKMELWSQVYGATNGHGLSAECGPFFGLYVNKYSSYLGSNFWSTSYRPYDDYWIPFETNTPYEIVHEVGTGNITINGTTYAGQGTNEEATITNDTLKLFWANIGQSVCYDGRCDDRGFIGGFSYFNVKDGDNYILKLEPYQDGSTYGMIDTLTNTFYKNAETLAAEKFEMFSQPGEDLSYIHLTETGYNNKAYFDLGIEMKQTTVVNITLFIDNTYSDISPTDNYLFGQNIRGELYDPIDAYGSRIRYNEGSWIDPFYIEPTFGNNFQDQDISVGLALQNAYAPITVSYAYDYQDTKLFYTEVNGQLLGLKEDAGLTIPDDTINGYNMFLFSVNKMGAACNSTSPNIYISKVEISDQVDDNIYYIYTPVLNDGVPALKRSDGTIFNYTGPENSFEIKTYAGC